MAIVLKRASRLPFAPIVAGLFALVAAVLVMATPAWLLETAVDKFGISSVISAAAPPLGMKAKALLALVAAFGTAATLWFSLSLLARLSSRKPKATRPIAQPVPAVEADVPVESEDGSIRRRRPIFADQELGAPFMSPEALSDAPILEPEMDEPLKPNELVLDMPFASAPLEPEIVLEPPVGAPVSSDGAIVDTMPVEIVETAEAVEDLDWPMPETNFEPDLVETAAAADFAPMASATTSIPVPPPPPEAHAQETITDLVERLERGVERRSAAIAAAQAAANAAIAERAVHQAETVSAVQPIVAQQPLANAQREVDSALSQALSTLERLAAGSR
jgi:hypothetical protein